MKETERREKVEMMREGKERQLMKEEEEEMGSRRLKKRMKRPRKGEGREGRPLDVVSVK